MLAAAARRQRVAGRPGAAARPGLRDRVGQGQQRPPRRLRRDRRGARPRRSTASTPRRSAGVFGGYEEVKRDQGRMDMEDVLLLTAGLLAEDERVAAQVRRQYKWFVVDEFQDVSPLQSALLDLWLGGRDEICVVGDPAQTIYSFAGANADLPPRLPREVPRHHLASSWSATTARRPQVVERRQPAARRLRQPAGSSCAPSAPAGPEVTLQPRTPTRSPRPTAVADADRRALRAGGTPLGEMAVLFRINAQSEAFEEALTARGIPYVVRGAARFFDRPEVRQAVTLLRGAARAGDRPPSDGVRVDDRCAATLAGHGLDARGARRRAARPATAGSRCRRWSTRPPSSRAARRPTAASAGFVDDLDRRARRAARAGGRRASPWRRFHAAKGLEWDVGVPLRPAGGHAARSPTPTPRRRSRRSAGCSTSG